jgi:hypothetical protein
MSSRNLHHGSVYITYCAYCQNAITETQFRIDTNQTAGCSRTTSRTILCVDVDPEIFSGSCYQLVFLNPYARSRAAKIAQSSSR